MREIVLVDATEESTVFKLEVTRLGGLYLNRRVIDLVFLLDELRDAVECVAGVAVRHNVGREDGFLVRDGPAVEVVNLFDEGQL